MILGVGGGFLGLIVFGNFGGSLLGDFRGVFWEKGLGDREFEVWHCFGIWFFGFWMAGCVWEGFRLGCVLQAWEMNFQIGFASGRKDGWLETVGEAGVVELAALEI